MDFLGNNMLKHLKYDHFTHSNVHRDHGVFNFSISRGRWIHDPPQEDLAKFGYK
jgi:hypothetical protein